MTAAFCSLDEPRGYPQEVFGIDAVEGEDRRRNRSNNGTDRTRFRNVESANKIARKSEGRAGPAADEKISFNSSAPH